MNRQTTLLLAAIALVLGLTVLVSEFGRAPRPGRSGSRGAYVLDIQPADIQRISVKRDYWNSFTLARTADGSWKMIDPAEEPAAGPAVEILAHILAYLPIGATIDLPMNDSERYQEYGLWEPREQITVVTGEKEYTLLFGSETIDQTGVYCVIQGQDNVYVTPAESFHILSLDLETYRASPDRSAPADTHPAED